MKAPRNPRLWALYLQGPSTIGSGLFDLYYIGFQSDASRFNDVAGAETRHSVGMRSSGRLGEGAFSYNTELIVQFGRIAGNTIQAFNVETDWVYRFQRAAWQPALGVKLDWSTGDRGQGDGTVHTFNPLFVNPGIYSLAGVNTPANLTSFHPSITLYPVPGLSVFLEYAVFFRTQEEDGFYGPPRFQTRPADGISARHIGRRRRCARLLADQPAPFVYLDELVFHRRWFHQGVGAGEQYFSHSTYVRF